MVSTQRKYLTPALKVIIGFAATSVCAAFVFAQNATMNGRALFGNERKGNCTACHKTPTDASLKGVSNIGPALQEIKQKYPTLADRARLRDAVWDQGKYMPDTIMPPYGKHHILSETEIDAIVAYLETL